MAGQLYLIGTPIGNLGDITLRAIQTLQAVERIYAEDTRHSRVLLNHLGVHGKKLLALHAHSTERELEAAVQALLEGASIALITDAGMPGVSDPGAELVRRARAVGVAITVIPGPSAVTSAVALSGLVDGPFSFLGFLPRRGKNRQEMLRLVQESTIPTLLFESPHRVTETLADLAEVCGPRPVALCRELTKKFEEVISSTLDVVSAADFRSEWLGEFTLVIAGRGDEAPPEQEQDDLEGRARALIAEGHSARETAQLLSRELAAAGRKMSRRDVYTLVLLAAPKAALETEEEGS